MPQLKDITGQRFGKLFIVERVYIPGKRGTWYKAKCDCGNDHQVCYDSVVHGESRSCGCLQKQSVISKNFVHGHCGTGRNKWSPEYRCYTLVKQRCYNPNNPGFKDYGGRGIGMSAEWKASFIQFFEDMGKKPSPKHSLQRVDNDGPYSKENCIWDTPIKQANNKRSTRFVETEHGKIPLRVYCYKNNIQAELIWVLLQKGLSVDGAIKAAIKKASEYIGMYYPM